MEITITSQSANRFCLETLNRAIQSENSHFQAPATPSLDIYKLKDNSEKLIMVMHSALRSGSKILKNITFQKPENNTLIT